MDDSLLMVQQTVEAKDEVDGTVFFTVGSGLLSLSDIIQSLQGLELSGVGSFKVSPLLFFLFLSFCFEVSRLCFSSGSTSGRGVSSLFLTFNTHLLESLVFELSGTGCFDFLSDSFLSLSPEELSGDTLSQIIDFPLVAAHNILAIF